MKGDLTQADKDRLADPTQTSTEEYLAELNQIAHDKFLDMLYRFIQHLRARGIQVEPETVAANVAEEFAQQERPR